MEPGVGAGPGDPTIFLSKGPDRSRTSSTVPCESRVGGFPLREPFGLLFLVNSCRPTAPLLAPFFFGGGFVLRPTVPLFGRPLCLSFPNVTRPSRPSRPFGLLHSGEMATMATSVSIPRQVAELTKAERAELAKKARMRAPRRAARALDPRARSIRAPAQARRRPGFVVVFVFFVGGGGYHGHTGEEPLPEIGGTWTWTSSHF